MSTRVASDVLGTFGAVFWSIQLLPQIWINYKRPKHTEGLQPSMMLFWAAAAVPLGIYNILSHKPIALQIQPQILASLSLVTWGQCYYYPHNWSLFRTSATCSLLGIFGAGLELLGVLPFRLIRADGSAPHAYLEAMAILSAIGLGLGVLRHYYDIWVHRSVRGISFIFVALDAAGDLTSLLSVVLLRPIDTLGAVIYGVELVLWMGIMALGLIYNFRRWVRSKRRAPPGVETTLEEHEMAQRDTPEEGERASLAESARSSSVFHTVGLRRRMAEVLKVRQRAPAAPNGGI